MTTATRHRVAPEAPAGVERLLAGLVADRPVTLERHLARIGRLPSGGRELLQTIEESGLRGRGGAAFDVATKLRSVAAAAGRAVVVANGVEGEPASGKDKMLLRLAPHLVLDGAVVAARCVRAQQAVIAVSDTARAELASVRRALAERRDGDVQLSVATVPGRFVTGEETALLQSIGGGKAKPTTKPPYPFERGLRGAPTLVQNVETLAHLALIARFGDDWFRSIGTERSPGTALVTVSGAINRGGVHEIGLGSTLGALIGRAGGSSEPVSAVLVGGYFGRWVGADDATGLTLVPENLGAGAIVVLPATTCGPAECARVIRYLAGESAGQCGPCVHGLAAIADAFDRLAVGDQHRRPQLERWLGHVRGRGACKHPDGVAGFVSSSLDVFARELGDHARAGRCRKPCRGVLPVPRRRR